MRIGVICSVNPNIFADRIREVFGRESTVEVVPTTKHQLPALLMEVQSRQYTHLVFCSRDWLDKIKQINQSVNDETTDRPTRMIILGSGDWNLPPEIHSNPNIGVLSQKKLTPGEVLQVFFS
ncbi:MAG: hypothetical protein WCT40_02000 [Candidatus Magasanikbacteria bacterium]|jgi:hypothetical protein